MTQIKIQDLLPLLRPGWVAMDKDGSWNYFVEKPVHYRLFWGGFGRTNLHMFNIALFDGDWRKSLMECGNV